MVNHDYLNTNLPRLVNLAGYPVTLRATIRHGMVIGYRADLGWANPVSIHVDQHYSPFMGMPIDATARVSVKSNVNVVFLNYYDDLATGAQPNPTLVNLAHATKALVAGL